MTHFFSVSSILCTKSLVNFVYNVVLGILGGPESGALEDEQVILDPASNLGMFLRRCILAFNLLAFEVLCFPIFL